MRVSVALFHKLKQALIVLLAGLSINSVSAADFSQAQEIYVPPSLLTRYDGAPFGQANTGASYIDSTVGLITSADGSASGGGGLSASDVMGAISQASNLPGISNIKTSLQNFLQQGNLGQAEALASKYYKAIPTPLLNQLGNAATSAAQKYLQNHDLGAAGDQIRQALAADPSNKTTQSVYGQILKASGLNPNSAADHITLGNTLTGQGKFREACLEYNNALAIKPSAEAHVGLGNIAYALGRADLARNEYEKALAVDPKSELALRQRGLLKYALQDQIGANADLSKALSLCPEDHLAGEALLELWRRQVAANTADPNGHLGLARAYMLIGDLDSAQTEYQEVARLDPNNAHLPAARNSFKLALAKREANNCFEAAKTLEHEGAINDAQKKITEAISYYPHDVAMLLCQGKLSERLGLYEEAHQAYLGVLKEDPKNNLAAARLKKMQTAKISENVSAKVEKPATTGDSAPTPALRDPLTPETPTIDPGNQAKPQPIPIAPHSGVPSTYLERSDNAAASLATSALPIDNLSNFICSVRELAINQQLQRKEIDRINKESLKAAQANLGLTTGQNKDSDNGVSISPSALPSVASCVPGLDPSLGF
jgi:tetratricopeptide (TPR) repeat protein